jgi:protein-tyrosine phosphatase
MADGYMRTLVADAGLDNAIAIDSAGTGNWHIGAPPDARMQETARRHQVDLSPLRARQFNGVDFEAFDLILAMDTTNLRDMQAAAHPGDRIDHVMLFRSFDPVNGGIDGDASHTALREPNVPDPYFGGADGFEEVYQMVARTCREILSRFERRQLPGQSPK